MNFLTQYIFRTHFQEVVDPILNVNKHCSIAIEVSTQTYLHFWNIFNSIFSYGDFSHVYNL